MSNEKTIKYHKEVYNTITDLYLYEGLSIPKACAKIPISLKTYYNICKKFNVPSIANNKDVRLDLMEEKENNQL